MIPDTKILRFLLNELKVNVIAPYDKNSTPPLHAAHYNSNAEIVKLLIDAKANVNSQGGKNWTPFYHTARHNSSLHISPSPGIRFGCCYQSAGQRRQWSFAHGHKVLFSPGMGAQHHFPQWDIFSPVDRSPEIYIPLDGIPLETSGYLLGIFLIFQEAD